MKGTLHCAPTTGAGGAVWCEAGNTKACALTALHRRPSSRPIGVDQAREWLGRRRPAEPERQAHARLGRLRPGIRAPSCTPMRMLS
eukprot:5886734-Alexandrium_andersonii.AAC.1